MSDAAGKTIDLEQTDVTSGSTAGRTAAAAAFLEKTGGVKSPAQAPGGDAPAPAPEATPAAAAEGVAQEVPADETPADATAWAALRKAEQSIRQQQQALKNDRALMQQQFDAMAGELKQVQESQSTFRENLYQDPVGTLADNGVEFSDLADAVINDPESASTASVQSRQLEQRFSALEQQLKASQDQVAQFTSQQATSQQNTAFEDVLAQDEFKVLQSHPAAVQEMRNLTDLIQKYQNRTLTPAEAAGMLQEEWGKQIQKFSSNDAVKELLGVSTTPPATTQQVPASSAPQQQASPQSLSGSGITAPAVVNPGQQAQYSDDDRKAFAAKSIPADFWTKSF